jgi:hypothetical protein
MRVNTILSFLPIIGIARSGDLCAYPVGAQAHCDVSATHVCCNNFNSGECCTFVQNRPNSHLGGSVSCGSIDDNDECQSYQSGFSSCTQFVGQILGPGCIASSTAAGFANFFVEGDTKIKRDQICREPNMGVYTDSNGTQRKISIPTGQYQDTVRQLMEDDVSQLALLEDYGKKLSPL